MRTGRPPKKPADRKTAGILIPLTAAERELVKSAAEADASKHVTWSREVILAAATKRLAKGNDKKK